MSDFITISCPSCGGQLRRGTNTTTYTCDYCGQQHRLRVEDIEEFGRCPVCQRNDRVEIVRAIYNKGGSLADQLAPPIKAQALRYQPKAQPKNFDKQTFIQTLPESKLPKKTAKIIYRFSLIALVVFIFVAAVSKTWALPILFLVLGIAGLGFSVYIQIKNKVDIDRKWKSDNEKLEKGWSQYVEKYDRDYKKRYAFLEKNYPTAKNRYDNLYYCHRDDCVFIPGESGYAPSAKMEEFLFREAS